MAVDRRNGLLMRLPGPRLAVASAPRSRLGMSRRKSAVLYTLPAWGLIVAVVAVPLAWGFWLSLRNEGLNATAVEQFVGLGNYRRLLEDDAFVQALRTTAVLTGLSLALQLPLGYLLASTLARELRGSRLFRSALLLPMLLTPVAVGLMWRFMFNSDLGVINWFLDSTAGMRPDWLGDRHAAVLAVVVVDSWQNVPFVMLMFLAGLQSLPRSPIEAAAVDGASAWQTFRYVVAPMLAPVVLVVTMIRIVESVKLFDIIYIVTQGGPGTATQNLSTLTYRTGFSFLATSRAAAIGFVLLVLLLPVYFLWTRATRL